jgi:hypothetical protein
LGHLRGHGCAHLGPKAADDRRERPCPQPAKALWGMVDFSFAAPNTPQQVLKWRCGGQMTGQR